MTRSFYSLGLGLKGWRISKSWAEVFLVEIQTLGHQIFVLGFWNISFGAFIDRLPFPYYHDWWIKIKIWIYKSNHDKVDESALRMQQMQELIQEILL